MNLTSGSTQTPKPTLFLCVALRLRYHKKLSGLGPGEPSVTFLNRDSHVRFSN